jgi:dsRNA-specific ribonuclease
LLTIVLAETPKNAIQEVEELCQKCSAAGFSMSATWQETSREGPSHNPIFQMKLKINEIPVSGTGQSKQLAREAAAKFALTNWVLLKALHIAPFDKNN